MSDDDWETAADDGGLAGLSLGDDAVAAAAGWEGEDEDDGALLDGDEWDDDKPKAAPAAVPVPAKPKKLAKKKILEKQAKLEEEARRRAAAMSAADAAAAKAEEQRRVEEADNELTEELFMGGGAPDAGEAAVPAKSATISNVVEAIELEKDADYQEFGASVASKVELGDPVQIKLFLDVVLKQVCVGFRLDDVNDVKKTVTVMYNEIRQAEVGKKKKGGKKKKFVNTGGANDEMDEMSSAQYDDPDDFDFI